MRIFISGVACVGKTTIGALLADHLDVPFYDFDREVESFFEMPISRIQIDCLTMHGYQTKAVKALKHILAKKESEQCVISFSPSGLMSAYWRVVKKTESTIIVLNDFPENILKRITFYDDDLQLMDKILTEKEKKLYLREIKKDITYYKKSYARAHISVDINGLGPEESALKVKTELELYQRNQVPVR